MNKKSQERKESLTLKVIDTQQELQMKIWRLANHALIDEFLSIEEVLLCLESIKIRLMLGWKEQEELK